MLDLKLTDEIRQYAYNQVKTHNFGQRSSGFNGNFERQYTGIVGECIVYKALNKELPQYDSGSLIEDIVINNKKIDIKSMARNVDMKDFYVHNFVGYQKNFPNDIYIFNSIVKQDRTIQICGWLPKDEFFMKCSFFDKGMPRFRSDGSSFKTKAPLYEIENKELNAISTEEDVRKIGL